MILTIDNFNDDLHQVSSPVLKSEWISLKPNVSIMKELCLQKNGIGLAAPQINIFKQFFIMKTSPNHFELIINPSIISQSKDLEVIEEGCLSCPGLTIKKNRYKEIKVSYFNSLWTQKFKTLRGLESIIFQHEYDHLKGVLITDTKE